MKEFSTYKKDDVIFLLKDISDMIVEEDNMTREKKIQSGKIKWLLYNRIA